VVAVGERLKEERLLRGWSQRDLAREAGTTAETISSIETGQHEPRPSTLRKLAEGLGIEVRDFFAEPSVPLAEAPRGAGRTEVRGRGTGWLEDLVAGLARQEAGAPASQEAEEAAEAEITATLENLLNELHQLVEVVSDQDERYEVAGRVEKAYTNLIDGLERSLRLVAEAAERSEAEGHQRERTHDR
jgi:transcriptional regulator with XRE-family HTH domain